MEKSKYWWKITTVHGLHNTDPRFKPNTFVDAGWLGYGPNNADESITANKAVFKLYDDDGILYYTGEIFGEYDGFEPLDDFGAPCDGCTGIKIDGEWL